jgi:hypothetical protein
MTIRELFLWSPFIALALGVLAGLGSLRSWRFAYGAVGLTLLLQLIGWPVLFVHFRDPGTEQSDWQVALETGFVGSLLVVFPYTSLGAVLGGVVGGLIRRRWGRPGGPEA